MPTASETQGSTRFPAGIVREITPLSMWGGGTLVYRSIIVLALIALPVIAAVNFVLRDTPSWPQLALAGSTLAIALVCLQVSRMGRHDIAGALLVGLMWCAITIYAITSGYGMHSAAVFMYLPCILYAELFFGMVVAGVQLGLTIAVLVLMYLAEERGQLAGASLFAQDGTNFNFLVGVVITCIGTLVIGAVYHRRVEREAARVVAEAERRRAALEAGQSAQAQLETAHAKLAELNGRLQAHNSLRDGEFDRLRRHLEQLELALAHDLPAAMRDGNGHAADLAATLQELAIAGSKPLAREPLDLSALARDAARATQATPGCAHVRIDIEAGLHANGDRKLVAVLLRQLLLRSARNCRAEPAPEVQVGSGSLQGRPVLFVRDNGPALDTAQRERLFQPFGSATGNGADASAACARRIVERHGGELELDAMPDQGTTLRFSLPG